MKRTKVISFIIICFFASFSEAGVNLKNGNFYTSYTDIMLLKKDHKLEVTRTYNSKSSCIGWFGAGWGSTFETNLTETVDGTILIHEFGGGAATRFAPLEQMDGSLIAEKISDHIEKYYPNDAKYAASDLANNPDQRQFFSEKYHILPDIPVDTVLYSNIRGLERVYKTNDGYRREQNDGRIDIFNTDGRLTKHQDKYGYEVSLNYKDGKLYSVADTHGSQLFFDWYKDGRVKHVWSDEESKASYQYDNENLVYSKDAADNEYNYEYDDNHNMITVVSYGSGQEGNTAEKQTVEYSQEEQMVVKITEVDGAYSTYEYGGDLSEPNFHYWTNVTSNASSLADIRGVPEQYEYEVRKRTDGSNYTFKITSNIGGIEKETVFSERCSQPMLVRSGQDVTIFRFNDVCLLVQKNSTTGTFLELEYNEKFKKISKVASNSGWTNYKYDDQGSVVQAFNSRGQRVSLKYDDHGLFSDLKIQDGDGEQNTVVMHYEHSLLGKPTKINMENEGSVYIEYDKFGRIKNVDSDEGQKLMLKITRAFESCLSMLKPAGVSLAL